MAEFTKQLPPRGWSPKSPRLTMQGLQSLRLAMQQDTSSTAPAASYAITMAQDHNETPDAWTTEQSVRRSNTQQWVQQQQQQQSQSHWDIIPTDPMFRLEGDPQFAQQAKPKAVSPQLSQEEIDAEERARPENEIDSKFGLDAGLMIPKQLGVRKAVAADTAIPTKSNVHDHNHGRRGRYKRPFSSADTTAVNSTGSKSGSDAPLAHDVIQNSKTGSRCRAANTPSTASRSSTPPPSPLSALRCRHYYHHAWKRMCSGCHHRQRGVDNVVAAQQPQQQVHKQTHPRRQVLAPLVLQTISTGVKAMGQAIADVVRDAENYIMDTYIHQLDDVNNDINHNTDVDDGVGDEEDEVAMQSRPEHCLQVCFTDETPCPGVSLTALRAAVGVLLCIVVWIFARIAVLVGPERLFGVCLVAVLIFVGRAQSCAREVTATRGARDTGDEDKQAGHESYLSDTSV